MSGEYDFEPIPGLPGDLPAGETIMWQGAPDWRSLALRMFRLRWVAAYFAGLLAWRLAESGGDVVAMARATGITLGMGLAAMGVFAGLAWLMARATLYTITNRRLVIRSGVALPMIVNVPFNTVTSAALKRYDDGTGDVPMTTGDDQRIAYLLLWPNARPRHFSHTEPMLRCVPDVENVARILSRALAAATDQPVRATAPVSGAGTLPIAAIA